MMVGHCHTHPHHHHPRHQHRIHRTGSESSRDEQYSSSSNGNNSSSSDYSIAMSSEVSDRSSMHHSTASLIDSIEQRTQRTYRYGIGLVCLGATLNWLGFAQGATFIEPMRYFGITCVLTGSFCVCLAMCRWLGRPISVSGHHVPSLDDERSNGDVHVINVPVPMYVPSLHEDYRPQKPPDYEQIFLADPPPYDEAVKLNPGALFGSTGGLTVDTGADQMYTSQHLTSPISCQPSPSHHQNLVTNDLTRALLLDHQDNESLCGSGAPTITSSHPTPSHYHPHLALLSRSNTKQFDGSDPPPAYEPSPRPSISSCSSSAPLIPTSSSRFELPPSFSVRSLFGGGGVVMSPNSSTSSPNNSPRRIADPYTPSNNLNTLTEHLHDQIIVEDNTYSQQRQHQSSFVPNPHCDDGNSGSVNGIMNI